MPPSTQIYALYYLDRVTGTRRYFYVGQTKDVVRRVRQHRAMEARGHEDKYAFMRVLRSRGVAWQVEVLREVPHAEHPWDHEHWHVIALTRQGHALRNMRHGNRTVLSKLAAMVDNPRIRNAADVRRERERDNPVAAGARSKQLQREILKKTLAGRGIRDVSRDGAVLPPRIRARLLREGIRSIQRGVPLADIVQTARTNRETREFFARVRALIAPLLNRPASVHN